jgi:UDP-N-acetylmuramyl pentapeptide synthase
MDNKTTATVQYGKNSFHITTSLLGEHVIYNLLPCIGIASKLGMTKEEIEKAVKNLKPIKDKLSLHEGNSKYVKILSDCSNSNLEGFIQALKVGERLKNFDEKILITKGIIELGKDKKMSYEKILQELRNTSIKIYSTDKDFAEIHSSNLKNNLKGEKDQIEFFPMEEDMISRVEERIKKTGNSKKKLLLIIEGRFSSEVLRRVGKE